MAAGDKHPRDQLLFARSKASLPLVALNHVSRVCKDVETSAAFYRDILGFVDIKRPDSFDFEGRWLFNYCIGVHLIKGQPLPRSSEINPRNDHVSFQSDNLAEVEQRLIHNDIDYVSALVYEGGVQVKQIFFHDPDNNMIEICNCDCLPVIPLASKGQCSSSCDIALHDTAHRSLPQSSRFSASVDALLSPRMAVSTK